MDEENNAPSIKSPDEITIEEKTYEEKANPDAQTQKSDTETPEVDTQAQESSIETSELDTQTQEPSIEASTPDVVSPAPEVQPNIDTMETPEESKPSKKSRNIFIAVLVGVFLSLGAATTAVIIDHNNKSAEEQPKNSEQPTKTPAQASELKLTGNSLSDFDLKFLQLENEVGNKIYSPLSIKYALAMLKDGAAGDSKTQIENLIGNYTPKAYINSENRSLANALFVRDTFKENIKESYTKDINTKYAAELITDPFVNAININNWISEKTLGIIPNLVQDDVVKSNDFILTNALAIDMSWNYQLQCDLNDTSVPCKPYDVKYNHENYTDKVAMLSHSQSFEPLTFNGKENIKSTSIGASINNYDIIKELGEDYIRSVIKQEFTEWLKSDEAKNSPDSDKEVDAYVDEYMERLGANYGRVDFSTDFTIHVDEDANVFAKDLKEYDGDTLQYVAIMPKSTNLTDYVKNITAENTQKLIDSLKPIETSSFKQGVVTKINGHIPLFHYNSELQLKKDLQELGVGNVFDPGKADLSGLTSSASAISDAIHVADIDFSNDGIKAAAVTMMAGIGATGAPHFEHLWDVPVEEIDLTFDKPFFFLIRDKATGEVWFTGTVYEPTINE